MDSLLGLDGKASLVVGGGQGMGRAAALLLARAGADVAVVDLVRERAEEVAGELRELGRQETVIPFRQVRGLIVGQAAMTAARSWESGGLEMAPAGLGTTVGALAGSL